MRHCVDLFGFIENPMSTIITVAVAVIHYQDQYLLGFRNAKQHQGKRYEFVGGKIEADETPAAALVREVAEEIGCDVSGNPLTKLGVIYHDYADTSVALHIFDIAVSRAQFDSLQHGHGQEGQTITWVDKGDLLAKKYPLPEANMRILDWLTLPNTIFISHSLQEFASEDAWLKYYVNKLPQNAYFYVRLKHEVFNRADVVTELQLIRKDIFPILSYHDFALTQDFLKSASTFENFWIHLNHQQLMELAFIELPKNCRYFASCHDQDSLSKLNQLAKTHTVMGGFLSPVLPTPTHPDEPGLGWPKFASLAALSNVPVYALGGVTQAELPIARAHGAWGVAGIRLIEPHAYT